MVSADDWSRAIASRVLKEAGSGEAVYLTVDEVVLDEIGTTLLGHNDGCRCFIQAVRDQLRVLPSDLNWTDTPLTLPSTSSLPDDGPPRCTALLALLVLAATRCGDSVEGVATDQVFFPHLRLLLGGAPAINRNGLGELSTTGTEETLWNAWSRYLANRGRSAPQPPARTQSMRYWGRALDQAILTTADRKFLSKLSLAEKRRIERELARLEIGRITDANLMFPSRHHLRALWRDRGHEATVRTAIRNALAGVAGIRDPRVDHLRFEARGQVAYALQVTLPPRWPITTVSLGTEAKRGNSKLEFELPLEGEHPPLFFRLDNVAVRELAWARSSYAFVEGDIPTEPASTRTKPATGQRHFFLIPQSSLPDLERKRELGFVSWDRGRPVNEGWTELQEFAILNPQGAQLPTWDEQLLRFEGGLKTGESRGIPRLFSEYRGRVVLPEAGMLQVGSEFYSTDSEEISQDLPCGMHVARFRGREYRFEIVHWQRIVRGPAPTGWEE